MVIIVHTADYCRLSVGWPSTLMVSVPFSVPFVFTATLQARNHRRHRARGPSSVCVKGLWTLPVGAAVSIFLRVLAVIRLATTRSVRIVCGMWLQGGI